ncbi:MAG: hypothetical protein QOK48_627 [Blastocatellia bacterium]|nr:hypothetical protein [Blastocatellia bacterium]
MKDDVGQVESERLCSPDAGVNQIAEDEEWPEEAAVSFPPDHRQIAIQDLSNLGKIIRKKPVVDNS